MRKLLVLFILLPASCFTQNKFDNIITVNNYVSVNMLKSVLFDKGISTQTGDTTFIETNVAKLKTDDLVDVKYLFKRTDSSLVIRGQYRVNITLTYSGVSTTPSFETIVYWKDKSSRPRLAFNSMDEIAKALGSSITYSKK